MSKAVRHTPDAMSFEWEPPSMKWEVHVALPNVKLNEEFLTTSATTNSMAEVSLEVMGAPPLIHK